LFPFSRRTNYLRFATKTYESIICIFEFVVVALAQYPHCLFVIFFQAFVFVIQLCNNFLPDFFLFFLFCFTTQVIMIFCAFQLFPQYFFLPSLFTFHKTIFFFFVILLVFLFGTFSFFSTTFLYLYSLSGGRKKQKGKSMDTMEIWTTKAACLFSKSFPGKPSNLTFCFADWWK